VPTPTGDIDFTSNPGVAADSLAPTSDDACLTLAGAPKATTTLDLPMTLVGIELGEPSYMVHEQ
jgi:hypothetical protein